MKDNVFLKKTGIWIARGIAFVCCGILLIILCINMTLLIKGYLNPDKLPKLMGYSPLIVQSGSMEPEISVGDLVIIKDTDFSQLGPDDIISFQSGDSVVTHRIASVQESGEGVAYVTKGDNNNTEDRDPIQTEQIEGIYVAHFKGWGNIALFMQTMPGMFCFVFLPLCVCILLSFLSRRKTVKMQQEQIQKLQTELGSKVSEDKTEELLPEAPRQ